MTILGVDFSLTGTGVCLIGDGEAECTTIGSKPLSDWWLHPARVCLLADQVSDWALSLDDTDPAWLIESPSFASKGRGHDMVLSGWWLFVSHLMGVHEWEPPLRVAPAQLKKFATGKGNAGKDEVLLAAARRYPDVQIRNNNEADATILAAIGTAVHGEPFAAALTKYQQDVVDALRATLNTTENK